MGLIVEIYIPKARYSSTNSSNATIASRYDQVCVINADGPFAPDSNRPAVKLVKGNAPGTVKAIPAGEGQESKWWMASGALIDCCDSRFNAAVVKILEAQAMQVLDDFGVSLEHWTNKRIAASLVHHAGGAVDLHDWTEG